MAELLDIRRRLAARTDGRSVALAAGETRALFSMALAFAKYAELDGPELVALFETARAAKGIDQGAVDVLEALDYQWGRA